MGQCNLWTNDDLWHYGYLQIKYHSQTDKIIIPVQPRDGKMLRIISASVVIKHSLPQPIEYPPACTEDSSVLLSYKNLRLNQPKIVPSMLNQDQ